MVALHVLYLWCARVLRSLVVAPRVQFITTKEVFKLTDGIFRRKETKQIAAPADEELDAIKKLKELLDENIITQEEFEIKKKEILHL